MTTQKRTKSKKVDVNSAFLVYLIYFVCFIFVVGLILWFLSFTVKANEISEPLQEEFTLTARQIILPSEKDFEELQEMYRQISNSFADLEDLDVEIRRLYDEVKAAKVSSIANRHNNSLRDCSNSYENQLSDLQESISSYEEMYTAYLDSINDIPKCFQLYYEKHNEFNESLGNTYDVVFEKNQQCLANNEELFELSLEAQLIADTFYDEFFDPVSRLVQVESGNCPAEEQWFTAAVPENRVMSSAFPDTLYDVIHQKNSEGIYQYSTVASGAFDRAIPSDVVKKNVAYYLRGYVEIDIPRNVVFQARFTQGDGIWKAMDSGQYFCYKNFD